MKRSILNSTSLILLVGLAGAAWAQEGSEGKAPEAPVPLADAAAPEAAAPEEEAPDYPDPDLIIQIESGGKTTEARPTQKVTVGPEGKTVDAVVNVIRRFEVEGVRFDYPGEFVHELEIREHHVWTLAGQRTVILAFRYPGATNEGEMFKAFHESLAKEYGVEPKASTKTTLEYPGGKLEGLALQAVFKEEGAKQPVSQELFSVTAQGSVWIFALQDAPDPATSSTSAEYTRMRGMLQKSLTIEK